MVPMVLWWPCTMIPRYHITLWYCGNMVLWVACDPFSPHAFSAILQSTGNDPVCIGCKSAFYALLWEVSQLKLLRNLPEYGIQGKSQHHLSNRLGKDNCLCDGHETCKTCTTAYKLSDWITRWTKIFFFFLRWVRALKNIWVFREFPLYILY